MLSFRLPRALLALLLAGGAVAASAQQIFTCVDAKGRRLTSDRPIAECLDREQKELGSAGTVRRTIGPQLSANEKAAQEEQERKAADEKQKAAEEKRRERALLARYPNEATHDAERRKALNAVQEVILAANRRTADLQEQRAKLAQEAEFFKGDAAKMPIKLRRQLEENTAHIAGQQRFLDNQEEEKRRVNARFDQELGRLKMMWADLKLIPMAGASAAPPAMAAQAQASQAKR